ncbi:hypothetical protein EVG20_g5694 [Dentipellis fragilis]|uniref:Uncharacterized protein n=1 Tax=Dentipellis fragilis TaxID=205917 RepID=A0A4Y9YTT2_9AGAM|nr:hypothetical protein EVG20_g5694 [Dentipellis fragilis]
MPSRVYGFGASIHVCGWIGQNPDVSSKFRPISAEIRADGRLKIYDFRMEPLYAHMQGSSGGASAGWSTIDASQAARAPLCTLASPSPSHSHSPSSSRTLDSRRSLAHPPANILFFFKTPPYPLGGAYWQFTHDRSLSLFGSIPQDPALPRLPLARALQQRSPTHSSPPMLESAFFTRQVAAMNGR